MNFVDELLFKLYTGSDTKDSEKIRKCEITNLHMDRKGLQQSILETDTHQNEISAAEPSQDIETGYVDVFYALHNFQPKTGY